MIIRAVHNKNNPYCMVKRSTAQDARLPARALGLLIYLMSKPDDWEPTIRDICRRFPDIGKNQAYKIINEVFIPLGYARRVAERKNGKISRWVTEIYEEPVPDFGEVENPENQTKPVPENREVETSSRFLDPENRELQINRVQSTDLLQEQNREQQASSGADQLPAAASDFDEPHLSAFPRSTVEAFVIATKKHAKNPGGLARLIWRTGEEDGAIGQWRAEQEERRELEERLRDAEEASDFDWDEHVDRLIEKNDVAQLENEMEGIIERGGPKTDWELRVFEYINRAASDAA